MSPFCVKCRRLMHCEKNGVSIAAYKPGKEGDTVHGYRGDMYKCPECGQEVVCFGVRGSGSPMNDFDFVLKE